MQRTTSIVGTGIGESQRRLLELVKRSGESTLAELEAGFDLNRETLRAHLKSLGAQGLVERSGVRRAGPGRPHVLFRLTPAGDSLFPRGEGAVLQELATYLVEQGRRDVLEKFFDARLARMRRELGPRVAGLAGRERLEAVAEILSEEGFVADVDSTGAGPRLRLSHCPLRDLVEVSDLPCRFELALIDSLLGERPSREAFIPEGSHACTYAVAGKQGTRTSRKKNDRRASPGNGGARA